MSWAARLVCIEGLLETHRREIRRREPFLAGAVVGRMDAAQLRRRAVGEPILWDACEPSGEQRRPAKLGGPSILPACCGFGQGSPLADGPADAVQGRNLRLTSVLRPSSNGPVPGPT